MLCCAGFHPGDEVVKALVDAAQVKLADFEPQAGWMQSWSPWILAVPGLAA
jgi:hypothetical protein